MEELEVRERAEALCAALVAGDVTQVTADFSEELQHNLGEVLALLVLPSNEATVDSVEGGFGSGYVVRLRLVGDSEEVLIQTRWKERDGKATVIEASHLSRTETAPALDDDEQDATDEASAAGT